MNPNAIRSSRLLALLFIVFFSLAPEYGFADTAGATETGSEHTGENLLGSETSPYLLQHKNNPIHWRPWGREAFETARKEKKPLFVSIGYSACYWCHVMEKDSFEKEAVAELLNAHFVSIKVDREERPDVDKIYMDAVMTLSGRGGWPLNVFLTPEGKPFFGATFLPRARFTAVAAQIAEQWKADPLSLLSLSTKLTDALKEAGSAEQKEPSAEILNSAFASLRQRFDTEHGGFGKAPKFPPHGAVALLLRLHYRSGSAAPASMGRRTLEALARGGIYDHIGGGFHRYSTDNEWLVPHFEKMLYDNALLAELYLDSYLLFKEPAFREIAGETLEYLRRDMLDSGGCFHSSEDAGEVGKEGEYYVWKPGEIKQALGKKKAARLAELYNVTEKGNFENGASILHIDPKTSWREIHQPAVNAMREKLRLARSTRTPPRKDDKVLTAWNGLAISAFSKGYQVLGDEQYLQTAQRCARFIRAQLYSEKELLRSFRSGAARHTGVLDDYAYLIRGLLDLHQSDFDQEWIRWAEALQHRQDELFWDDTNGGYFYSVPNDPLLIFRKKQFLDDALPSGNAIALANLQRLYDLTFDDRLESRAAALREAISGALARSLPGGEWSLVALDYHFDRAKELAAVGHLDSKEASRMRELLFGDFLPNSVAAFGKPAGIDDESAMGIFRGRRVLHNSTTFYVCENKSCKFPTNDPQKALELMRDKETLQLTTPGS